MEEPPAPEAQRHPRIAVITAAVLAVAGLLSAWASFQGAMWGGLEAEKFHVANAKTTESSRLALVARQREAENTGLFLNWLEAVADNQPKRAAWLERQFDPAFLAEFRRWRATMPADLAAAPQSTGRPRFIGLLAAPADKAAAEARAAVEAAQKNGETADRYDRWTVILATALFLAGIASVVRSSPGERVLVGLAALLTAGSLVALLMLPVSFGR